MQPAISSAAIMCPRGQHFCFLNCVRLLPPNCTIPKIRSRQFPCYGIDTSEKAKRCQIQYSLKFFTNTMEQRTALTKNDRLHCDAKLACHRLKLPSPSAIPNLLPCCENRQRVTLAKVPGGLGVHTTC